MLSAPAAAASPSTATPAAITSVPHVRTRAIVDLRPFKYCPSATPLTMLVGPPAGVSPPKEHNWPNSDDYCLLRTVKRRYTRLIPNRQDRLGSCGRRPPPESPS